MTKDAVADWDETAANNTDIAGINIGEGCPAPNLNNALREMMAQVRTFTAKQRGVFISSTAATAIASQEFTGLDTVNFRGLLVELEDIRPGTDDDLLFVQLGTGAGPAWQTSNEYGGRIQGPTAGADIGSTADSLSNSIALSRVGAGAKVGNAAGEGLFGLLYLPLLAVTSNTQRFVFWHGGYVTASNSLNKIDVVGRIGTNSAVTAMRFGWGSAGNFAASGRFNIYGVGA